MKRTPLVFAALAPFLAVAGEGGALQGKVDVQQLQDDIAVTDLIGADVRSQTEDEDAGNVQDVLIASDGRIEGLLVEGDVAGAAGTADEQRVAATETEDAAVDDGIPGIGNDDLAKIKWSEVTYNTEDDSVSLTGQAGASGSQATMQRSSGTPKSAGSTPIASQPAQGGMAEDSFRASDLVGMEVHLSDAESFGEVEDVMIDNREGKASALLVDTWDGFDKRTFALPVELDSVNRDEKALTYSYTESEVSQLEEYEKQ